MLSPERRGMPANPRCVENLPSTPLAIFASMYSFGAPGANVPCAPYGLVLSAGYPTAQPLHQSQAQLVGGWRTSAIVGSEPYSVLHVLYIGFPLLAEFLSAHTALHLA